MKGKKEIFSQILENIEKYETIIVSSCQNIPASKLQEIRKKLKGKIIVKAVKKKMSAKIFEQVKKENVAKLAGYTGSNALLIFSNLDAFEIASLLSETKFDARAKAGQIAEKDIVIEAGITDMPPGPIVSELNALSIKTKIEAGKIAIKESIVLVKAGEKISVEKAELLFKLNIMPFRLGLEVIAAYDSRTKKIYAGIKIDKEETRKSIIGGFKNALSLASSIGYPCKENIAILLGKAEMHAKALAK